MRGFRRFRELLHRRYLRAAIVGLALAASAGAIGVIALELRFGVPAQGVVRYFTRLHSDADDLKPLLRRPATLAALKGLSHSHTGMNPGGLVYSHQGRLRFYPWMPAGSARAADRRSSENQEIYSRLLPKYFSAELDELIAELSRPWIRRSLGRLGVSPGALEELRRLAAEEPEPVMRRHLLRRAGRLIRPFMPNGADRHHLELGDKLRFYSSAAPPGRYVGLYEVRGPGWLGPATLDPLPASGRLLTITKEADGEILIVDLRPTGRRAYRLIPIRHPAGLPLYRLGRRA